MHSSTVASIDHPDGTRAVFATVGSERIITVSSRRRRPVANVLLVHGLGDYPARHLINARHLAARGYRTVMVELAAHGGHAGEWAQTMPVYEAYARTERSVDLLRSFRSSPMLSADERCAITDQQYARLERTSITEHLTQVATVLDRLDVAVGDDQQLPLFLVGHSMGGLLVHETAWRMNPGARARLAGVVLIAPAFAPQGNPQSLAMQLALNGLWALRRAPVSPTRTAVKAVLDLNFGVDTTWGKKWLSDVPDEVELFATDPLVPHRLPTRYASSIESLMAESSRRGPRVPYDGFVLIPRRDGITSREAAVTFAGRANRAHGATRVALASFDVVAHDIFRSSARERSLSSVLGWLDGRVHARARRTMAIAAPRAS